MDRRLAIDKLSQAGERRILAVAFRSARKAVTCSLQNDPALSGYGLEGLAHGAV